MKKWKVALVGCGSIADGTYLPFVHRFPNVEMVAVCDIIPERAKAYAEKFNVPAWYGSLAEMLEKADFEILMDTASIPAHHELNMLALKAGKHLYSQKPIGLTVEQVDEEIAAAKAAGVKFQASPIHMLRPDIRWAKQMIEKGTIGKVSLIRALGSHGGPEYFQFRDADPTWFHRKGAGVVYDLAVHALHMVTGLLGPAKSFSCTATISEPTRTVRSGVFDGMVMRTDELYDNLLINLDFGGGTIGIVESNFVTKATKCPSLEIMGTKGTISFTNDPKNPLEVYLDDQERYIRGWMQPQLQELIDRDFFQCKCLKDLIEAIEEDRPVGLPPEHARHVVEIMSKLPDAAREHKTVELETTF